MAADLDHIIHNMTEDHVIEVMASSNMTPRQAIESGMVDSDFVTVGCIDGEPCSVFGLVQGAILGGVGVPWMLGTDLMAKHPRQLMRASREVIDQMLEISPYLTNHVHARYESCIRWLVWLGFTVHPAKPYGPLGELFCEFTMSKSDV